MLIHDMFAKDIDRSINGVVKVAQDDDASIRSELEEYVITRELRKHFAVLLERYDAAIDTPTDKIGVWISGFFGSGKSHFLKMLSYLLSNRVVDGKPTIEYFADKFDDPLMAERARRCASVPCEAILFNIDNKGPAKKDKTAILRTFARVFYEHLGYYGENLNLVHLEKFIRGEGKETEFSAAYERIVGRPWVEGRKNFRIQKSKVVQALEESGVTDREGAENFFAAKNEDEPSIDTLVEDIRAYVDARRAESPQGTFRLLFMVDEMGQYIASDVNLMLNLQTLVEELGARCGGSVWVMVTGQEAIDEITQVAGNDFSKIQGRFNTRLALSSSSVDEVIKARVLAKTPQAQGLLSSVYATNAAAMRNLFVFKDSRGDLQGFSGEDDFIASFPFPGYQFKVMQDVLTGLRTHGFSGKSLSQGERSMLSGFQEAAQAVKGSDEYALVPFWRFYDTLGTFLEHYIRQVIDRCAQQAAEGDKGLMPQDPEVLKLLLLILHVDNLKANRDNIAIMMADRMDVDIVALRERVDGSLDRLERQNYIARTGEVYSFLTDEEQDIAREIDHQQVSPDQVTRELGNAVYGDILDGLVKVRDGGRDFSIDRYLDETPFGAKQDALTLRVVTSAWQPGGLGMGGEEYVLASNSPAQVLVVLGDAENYYVCAQRVLKIQTYVASKQGTMSSMPQKTRDIIAKRQEEKRDLQKDLKRMLAKALTEARVYVAGRELAGGNSETSARKRVEYALVQLVDSVYHKRGLIQLHADTDPQLRGILLGENVLAADNPNAEACEMMAAYLTSQAAARQTVTMKALQDLYQGKPFGWSEFDVAAVAAQLVYEQKARVLVVGAAVQPKDPKLPDLLHNRAQTKNVVIEARRSVPDGTINGARTLLRGLSHKQDVPQDEDGLVEAVKAWLDGEVAAMDGLLSNYDRPGRAYAYPGKPEVEAMQGLCRRVLGAYGDAATFLGAFNDQGEDLQDAAEDLEDVEDFFSRKREQFDNACAELAKMEAERAYLEGNVEACEALDALSGILGNPRPYEGIKNLATLVNKAKAAHTALVGEKRRELLSDIEAAKQGVAQYAGEREGAADALTGLEGRWIALRDQANRAVTCEALDALCPRLDAARKKAYSEVDAAADKADAQKHQREIAQQRMAAEKARIEQGGAGESRVVTSHVAPSAGVGAAQSMSAATTSVGRTSPAAAPQKPIVRPAHEVDCGRICDPRRLRTEDEIDAYVTELAEKLKTSLRKALQNNEDGIRLV